MNQDGRPIRFQGVIDGMLEFLDATQNPSPEIMDQVRAAAGLPSLEGDETSQEAVDRISQGKIEEVNVAGERFFLRGDLAIREDGEVFDWALSERLGSICPSDYGLMGFRCAYDVGLIDPSCIMEFERLIPHPVSEFFTPRSLGGFCEWAKASRAVVTWHDHAYLTSLAMELRDVHEDLTGSLVDAERIKKRAKEMAQDRDDRIDALNQTIKDLEAEISLLRETADQLFGSPEAAISIERHDAKIGYTLEKDG